MQYTRQKTDNNKKRVTYIEAGCQALDSSQGPVLPVNTRDDDDILKP